MSALTLHVTTPRYRPYQYRSVLLASPTADLGSLARFYYRESRRLGTGAGTARLATIGILSSLFAVTVAQVPVTPKAVAA